MCFAFIATAAASEGPTDEEKIKQLEEEIKRLQEANKVLQQALNEAMTNPPAPVQRRPLIQVTEPLLIEIEAGDERTLTFHLHNLSTDVASNVTTSADLSGAPGITGFFLDSNNNIASMGSRAQRTFLYRLVIDPSVKAGFYTVAFNHTYRNANGEMMDSTSKVTVRVTSAGGQVSLRNIASSASRVAPGQDFNLTAVIENESALDVKDVSMTIASGMDSNGIFLRSSTNIVSISNLAPGKKENVSIGFTASVRAKSGAYPLTLELSYRDSLGEKKTQQYSYFISVGGGTSQENASEIIISNITYPRGSVGVGQEFEMVVTLKNTGRNIARNIRVDAVTDPERAIVPRSTSRMTVDQLAPDAERQLSFKFSATSLSTSRNYDLGFTLSYDSGVEGADGSGETVTFTQYQGVNVYNPDKDNDTSDPLRISTPRIIVSDYKSDPMIVLAGKEFDLELSFMNTSSIRTVRNIRVTLTINDEVTAGQERRGSVFTPVGRSSTFFIDTIAPGDEVQEHIRFYTLPDAPPRNYIIDVNFEYEDTDNNPFNARESIGINVKQVTKLDISEVFMPDSAAAYQPIYVNFELYNTGKVTLSNLMIKVEGGFMANQPSMFYGSMSPGMMDFYDNMITPVESGMQELAIVISYEDDTGELIEDRKVFYLDVYEMDYGDSGFDYWQDMGEGMVWDDNLQMWVPAPTGLSLWVIIAIAAGGLVIAGATVFIILRARKKKRNKIIDEEAE